jgi:hypothetical protein
VHWTVGVYPWDTSCDSILSAAQSRNLRPTVQCTPLAIHASGVRRKRADDIYHHHLFSTPPQHLALLVRHFPEFMNEKFVNCVKSLAEMHETAMSY